MADKPLCIDLCCGIGGWAEGFLAAGYDVIGFDIRTFKKRPYPGKLVLYDIRALDGTRFQRAHCIVASPPCTEFTKSGQPWHRSADIPSAVALVNECWRIITEAQTIGVIENVCFAQRWIGKADAHFGSFYLWGNVPLIRPTMNLRKGTGTGRYRWTGAPPEVRAKIPFDLAYWLATEWQRTAA